MRKPTHALSFRLKKKARSEISKRQLKKAVREVISGTQFSLHRVSYETPTSHQPYISVVLSGSNKMTQKMVQQLQDVFESDFGVLVEKVLQG